MSDSKTPKFDVCIIGTGMAGMASALLADYLVTPILFRMFKIFGEEKENPRLEAEPLSRSRKISMN